MICDKFFMFCGKEWKKNLLCPQITLDSYKFSKSQNYTTHILGSFLTKHEARFLSSCHTELPCCVNLAMNSVCQAVPCEVSRP
jgi:hypothetical protein